MAGRPPLRSVDNVRTGAFPAQPEHHPQFDQHLDPRTGQLGLALQLFHQNSGSVPAAQPYIGSVPAAQPYIGSVPAAQPTFQGRPEVEATAPIRGWRLPISGHALRAVRAVVLVTAGSAGTSWLVGSATQSIAGNKMAPWILGRASGITAYLLMVLLVALGLVLSHPWRARFRRPSSTQRIRAHISLAVFTLAFLVLHIVVLATDQYAKVGWWGALLPMASQFRPVAVTLGVIGAYSGLLAGITAALAGRWARRVWWPIHKVSAISLVLVWAHGVMAGADTPALLWFYLVTAAGILALAASRYIVRTPGDRVRDLIESELPRAGGDR